jgi:hypothetical protein
MVFLIPGFFRDTLIESVVWSLLSIWQIFSALFWNHVMNFLNDSQAECINGGGRMPLVSLPPISITVAPVVAVLPQTAVSVDTAVLGGRIFSEQNQFAGIGIIRR